MMRKNRNGYISNQMFAKEMKDAMFAFKNADDAKNPSHWLSRSFGHLVCLSAVLKDSPRYLELVERVMTDIDESIRLIAEKKERLNNEENIL